MLHGVWLTVRAQETRGNCLAWWVGSVILGGGGRKAGFLAHGRDCQGLCRCGGPGREGVESRVLSLRDVVP